MSNAIELSETVEEAITLRMFELYVRAWDELTMNGDGQLPTFKIEPLEK